MILICQNWELLECNASATAAAAAGRLRRHPAEKRRLRWKLKEGKCVHNGQQGQGVGEGAGQGGGEEVLQPVQVALPNLKDPAHGHQETLQATISCCSWWASLWMKRWISWGWCWCFHLQNIWQTSSMFRIFWKWPLRVGLWGEAHDCTEKSFFSKFSNVSWSPNSPSFIKREQSWHHFPLDNEVPV